MSGSEWSAGWGQLSEHPHSARVRSPPSPQGGGRITNKNPGIAAGVLRFERCGGDQYFATTGALKL